MLDWDAIIRQHGALVWQTAYRLVGNDADAADCFQETCISALEFSRRQRVRDWAALLRRVATARALDRLRQRLRQADREDNLADWTALPSSNPGPVQAAADAEAAARLRRAVAQLPPQEAVVFCLRCLDGLSYRQIARELGIKVNTVGVALHRARSRLGELLARVAAEQET